jgi:serine/threonine-protein kinase
MGAAAFPRPFGNKYTLLSHLAIGGMADVFLAQHKGPAGFEKECVIKRILPHLGMDQDFVQMFLDEARIAARLSHPNIVQIFDLGQVDGDYFLAMEFIDGVNLEQVLDAERAAGTGALRWPLAVRIVADVAAGLDHAHKSCDSAGRPLGLVHRDVSPSNIMISWGGVSKILDFGIAKAVVSSVKRSRTEVGTIKGKIPYMSPEQLQGLPLDGRSDVFSLGVILYESLCGSRPFPADTAGQLTMQILHDEPRPLELLREDVPQGLRAIVTRALAKRPEDRWQSARDMKKALDVLLAEEHASCTAYDIEAHLRDLFPEGRISLNRARSSVPGTEETEIGPSQVGRVATPAEASSTDGDPPRERDRMRADQRDDLPVPTVTGVHDGPRLQDLSGGGVDVDLEHEEESLRRRRSGNALTVALVGLGLVTVVGLVLLRGYLVGKDKGKDDRPAAAADLRPAGAAASPDLAAPAAVDPPVRPPVEAPPKIEAPRPAKVEAPPKVEAPRPKAEVRKPPRPSTQKEKEPEGPVELPRLNPPPEE